MMALLMQPAGALVLALSVALLMQLAGALALALLMSMALLISQLALSW